MSLGSQLVARGLREVVSTSASTPHLKHLRPRPEVNGARAQVRRGVKYRKGEYLHRP